MEKKFNSKSISKNINRLEKCFPHLNQGLFRFRNILSKIEENYNNLAFPYHPNWSYCIPLIANHTLKDGTIVDIGIHIEDDWIIEKRDLYYGISANFVTSNEGPDYQSGSISPTSEVNKLALQKMKQLEIIDDMYILQRIADHNGFLSKFMNSDLDLWDMQDWIDSKIQQ